MQLKKVKTSYCLITLFIAIFIGFLIVVPQVIPSAEKVQIIALGVLYILIISAVYILFARLWQYLQTIFDKTRSIILSLVCGLIIFAFLLFTFTITSLGVGQGFMGGTLYKEFNFHQPDATIYIYDNSFLDPITAIKIRNKFWPTMKDLASLENCSPMDLKVDKHNDIVEFSGHSIKFYYNLRTKSSAKTYSKE